MTKLFMETFARMRCYSGVSEQEEHVRYSAYAAGRGIEES
jgi:hypothetical protein